MIAAHRNMFGLPMLLALTLGCSGVVGLDGSTPGTARAALDADNGLTPNGLITNGLITNGLSPNGLITNGLALNGLSTAGLQTGDFTRWFNSNPESYSDMVMSYVVRCAVPRGSSLAWTHPDSGVTYTWSGELGLTPGWASGRSITVIEEQLMTACLAAHVNKFGIHMTVSILGEDARGTSIPIGPEELEVYSQKEACFFGNLFTGQGVFAADDRDSLNLAESTPRGCGLVSGPDRWGDAPCAPMIHVGSCAQEHCQLDPTHTYYTDCTWQRVHYKPLTTRIRPQDIYRCGDGICQFTEHCGNGHQYDDCKADCGRCPP